MRILPIELDRTSATPLAVQLADRLRDAIRQGRVPAGVRLPSSRALADQLALARNTVVRAYETLVIEGLVDSRAASGFYAKRPTEPGPAKPPTPAVPDAAATPANAALPRLMPSAQRIEASRPRALYDFVPGRPSAELLPVKAWRRLLQGCLSHAGPAGLSDYGDPAGLPALRTALAAHLSISRGILADPARIAIVAGTQEGLSMTARVFVAPGATVLIEDPCYQPAALAFGGAGARLVPIPVDEEGLVTARLPETSAALLYVTPGHQFPTGHTLSMARRQELVAWARQTGCYLVEDDYDSEFQYDGSPLQALAGMAPDCTIHLGTFSTTLGPGSRLGYVIAPPNAIDAVRAAKASLSGANSWLDQAALAELIRSGSFSNYLARSRATYRESRDALLGALRRHFGPVELSGEAAGLHVLWRLPAGVPEAGTLERLARLYQVGVYSPASAGACAIEPSDLAKRSLLLGYAGLLPQQIEQGIARLSDAVDDTLDGHHDFVSELLVDDPRRRARAPSIGRRPSRRHALRERPAIRTIHPARASKTASKELEPMRIVRGIYRYPIKGLSPQPLRGIQLEAGKPFPFDRVFAMVRPGVPVDAESPRWAKKGLFLMLMLDEALAKVQTRLDVETLELTITRERTGAAAGGADLETLLSADLGTGAGREAVEAFFRQQVSKLPAAPKLVRSSAGHFMDKPDNVLSCINLATVRQLESEWGMAIHPLRFRANFYIDGVRPWEEFDWVGSDVKLGDVLFRVDRRNGRCGATNVNPVTGERDMDIPGTLRQRHGHKDLGVYLVARSSGRVVVGDEVQVPEVEPSANAPEPVSPPPAGRGNFICRGCYYVYEPGKVTPQGVLGPFGALDDGFVCPDCGTHKGDFRPYLAELTELRREPVDLVP